jgi:hypothetical protein
MHTNYLAVKHQQHRITDHHSKLDALGFFNQLTSDQLVERVESLLPDHRERTFPPTETLSLFMSQAVSEDRSCRKVVNQSTIARLIGGLPKCSTATGGYCKARARLPVDDEQSLLRTMIKTFENNDELLGDAFYATYFLIAELQEMGVDAVFEQHGSRKRSTDFRRGKKLGSKDHLIVI